ncbi:MAG: hypothetical protein L6Q93_04185 [Phycisphaerae bacterium]|nr:hypothetical protein [Phycisphaerae bacterium]NUQ08064.1 hypothetical protein [Phycisphaerae bacterium]
MRRSRGLSLVEVLASLTLIAGTMTALLLAQARSLRQLAATRQGTEAHTLAEELILTWKADPSSVTAQGEFNAALRWVREESPSWRTSTRELQEIRLRVYGDDGDAVLAEYVWLEAPRRGDR